MPRHDHPNRNYRAGAPWLPESVMRIIERIDRELPRLQRELAELSRAQDRILVRAEIAHLKTIKTQLKRRRPPEAGIAVPAVPPKGPLPKQGGAEAPLVFD